MNKPRSQAEEDSHRERCLLKTVARIARNARVVPTGHHEELERIWRDAELKLHATARS